MAYTCIRTQTPNFCFAEIFKKLIFDNSKLWKTSYSLPLSLILVDKKTHSSIQVFYFVKFLWGLDVVALKEINIKCVKRNISVSVYSHIYCSTQRLQSKILIRTYVYCICLHDAKLVHKCCKTLCGLRQKMEIVWKQHKNTALNFILFYKVEYRWFQINILVTLRKYILEVPLLFKFI